MSRPPREMRHDSGSNSSNNGETAVAPLRQQESPVRPFGHDSSLLMTSKQQPTTAIGGFQSAFPNAVGDTKAKSVSENIINNVKVRKVRVFDEITTSSEDSEGGGEEEITPALKPMVDLPSLAEVESMPRDSLVPGDDTLKVAEAMASHIKRPSSTSGGMPAAAPPTPLTPPNRTLSPNQLNIADEIPLVDVAAPALLSGENVQRGSTQGHRGDTQDDDGAPDTHKTFMTHVEDMWEFGKATDSRVLVMFTTTLVAFLLNAVGMPLSQVDVLGGACYTYWGYKDDCDAHIYTNRTEFITCLPIKKRLDVGAAFSMMTLFTLLVGLVCCTLMLYKNPRWLRTPIIIMLSIAFLFQMIAWAVIANIFVSRYCENTLLPRSTAYGVAFGMSVTSWLLLLIGMLAGVLLLVR
ncbi:putative amastin [Trypanosoma grayi]|uniref:putative amastin n=1 Tax=Trypanosoma grayi TaxID=71804 RepID=UPI0004F4A67E|nr:putative amastin [Trypanosoma grayi]KEG08522.1 putative amastin [Trypanosoma grayi]